MLLFVWLSLIVPAGPALRAAPSPMPSPRPAVAPPPTQRVAPRTAPAAPPPRRAVAHRPRVAVLILGTGGISTELADNLTEVLIVNLSARGKVQVVGKEAVKSRLGGTEKLVLRCINNKTCVGNVATSLALDFLIVGTLGKFEDQWLYNLYYLDASSAAEKKRVHKRVRGDVAALTQSLDAALAELLKPRVKPGTLRVEANVAGAKVHLDDEFAGTVPLKREALKPGPLKVRVEADGYYAAERTVQVQSGQTVVVRVELKRILPRVKTWKFHVAWAGVGVAAGSLVIAAVTGGLSRKVTGATQVARLDDVDRRKRVAGTANAFFVIAGAAAITSAALFLFARKDFYRGGKERQAWLELSPLPGGAYVSGGVRW